MNFLVSAHSDIGIQKAINQDSVLLKVANTLCGKVCLCVICDGMGGLDKGELASATVIRAFDRWFCEELSPLLSHKITPKQLQSQWRAIILEQNRQMHLYSNKYLTPIGTTVVAMFFIKNQYYLMNIGDSRAYKLSKEISQLTKDQTFVQREIDLGHLTYEEAKFHPKRNTLLQCVGASSVIVPEFSTGRTKKGEIYLLCSDGFRHVIAPQEIYQKFTSQKTNSEEELSQLLLELIELNKSRKETDNISAAVVKIV